MNITGIFSSSRREGVDSGNTSVRGKWPLVSGVTFALVLSGVLVAGSGPAAIAETAAAPTTTAPAAPTTDTASAAPAPSSTPTPVSAATSAPSTPGASTPSADPSLAMMNAAHDHTMGSTIRQYGPAATSATTSPNMSASSNTAGVAGLDISAWQSANLNWGQIYAQGGRFASIKATEGTAYRSGSFATQ